MQLLPAPDASGWRILRALAFAGGVTLAWASRFMMDDAFISFSYARALAEGRGLVWNGVERIEGYTNFLWTALLALPFHFGWDPVRFAWIAGVACFAATLLLTYQWACTVLEERRWAILPMFLLATNLSASSFATGGLETSLQTLSVTAIGLLTSAAMARGALSVSRALLLSLVWTVAMLTRMDAVLIVGCSLVFCGRMVWRERVGRVTRVAALLLPSVLVVGSWLIWRWSYYGALVPNTFFVKGMSGVAIAGLGVRYLWLFVVQYLALPVVVLSLAWLPRWRAHPDRQRVQPLVAFLATWLVYVLIVGGDFMEFRLLVPLLPLAFILFAWIVRRLVTEPGLRVALVVCLVLGSLITKAQGERHELSGQVESTAGLRNHLTNRDEAWVEVGSDLGAMLAHDSTVTIATTAAGAIPFFSRLRTVDMLGLSDPWVARNGLIVSSRPGHERAAPVAYLERRGVNLVVGHPWLVDPDSVQWALRATDAQVRLLHVPEHVPPDSPTPRIAAIALQNHMCLLTLVLRDHPALEAAAHRGLVQFYTTDGEPLPQSLGAPAP